MSLVAVTIVIACQALGIGMKSKWFMGFMLVLIMCFFIFDTHLIVIGMYAPMNSDDYIFASMKLFADFVLIFGIMSKLCE